MLSRAARQFWPLSRLQVKIRKTTRAERPTMNEGPPVIPKRRPVRCHRR